MSLVDKYWNFIASCIDEKGVYPHQAMALLPGDKYEVFAIDGSPDDVIKLVRKHFPRSLEFIYGLDRSTRPGQGTEFADVLTCAHYTAGADEPWRVGVINYQHEPRIVRPWDWNNQFWTEMVMKEVRAHIDPHLDVRLKMVQSWDAIRATIQQDLPSKRPNFTEEEAADYEERFQSFKKQVIAGEIKDVPRYIFGGGPSEAHFKEVMIAGYWLGDKLAELGCDEKQIEKLQFVQGQKAFLSDGWTAAKNVLQAYAEGLPLPEPGPQLAEEITKEAVKQGIVTVTDKAIAYRPPQV